MLNRNISQSQYDYESYNHQVHNQSQQRYYPHVTPPPAYSDMSSPSPNAYSISSRFSNSGIAASSTPRNGTLSINVTPSSNSMTNGYAFRPSQPPPAPPPNYVGYRPFFVLFLLCNIAPKPPFCMHLLCPPRVISHYLLCILPMQENFNQYAMLAYSFDISLDIILFNYFRNVSSTYYMSTVVNSY